MIFLLCWMCVVFLSLVLILPAPGEVRFYEGESGSPPAMMWCYKESRKLCSVSILPVPLTVMGEEDWPVDIKVRHITLYEHVQ